MDNKELTLETRKQKLNDALHSNPKICFIAGKKKKEVYIATAKPYL